MAYMGGGMGHAFQHLGPVGLAVPTPWSQNNRMRFEIRNRPSRQTDCLTLTLMLTLTIAGQDLPRAAEQLVGREESSDDEPDLVPRLGLGR